MATHSSLLAWRIPTTEEPVRLQSSGFQESDMTERLSTIVLKGEIVSLHFIKKFVFIYSVLAVLHLRCWAGFCLAVSTGHSGWMWWLLNVGSFSCCRAQVLGPEGFSSCGTWDQQLRLPGSRAQAQ